MDINESELARVIAFYLPQFHPIAQNDAWWGKGFTEWTNVIKARPLFEGHYQPHTPSELGFYDLRVCETREAQANLARQYGIHGFCYYHFWFNGTRLLERPFNEVLKTGKPDFPFCLCWANENWTRAWDGQDKEILMQQNYGAEDDVNHIRSLFPAFEDRRYIRVDEKPLFLVYRAHRMADAKATTERWRQEAIRAGFKGLYLLRVQSFTEELDDPVALGFDGAVEFQPRHSIAFTWRMWRQKWWHRKRIGTAEPGFNNHFVHDYTRLVERAIGLNWPDFKWFRCVCPSFDNSPRRAREGFILFNANPELYERWLSEVITQSRNHARSDKAPLVFVNAWNEWAEGNHLEPCAKWGRSYLEATRNAITGVRQSIPAK